MNYKFCNTVVKNSIAFCQNKAIPNIAISLNLSVTSLVIRRIAMFIRGGPVEDKTASDASKL